MASALNAPGRSRQPDPQDQAGPRTPSRFRRMLTVVRKIIGIGKWFAVKLQHPSSRHDPGVLELRFGTSNIGLILRSLIRGLHRATVLEARLVDLSEKEPWRKPGWDRIPPPRREPREPRDPSSPARQPAQRVSFEGLSELERIAAEASHRPIASVVMQICSELGIIPGDLGRTGYQLLDVLAEFGAGLNRYLKTFVARAKPRSVIPSTAAAAPGQVPRQAPAPDGIPDGTGPPDDPLTAVA